MNQARSTYLYQIVFVLTLFPVFFYLLFVPLTAKAALFEPTTITFGSEEVTHWYSTGNFVLYPEDGSSVMSNFPVADSGSTFDFEIGSDNPVGSYHLLSITEPYACDALSMDDCILSEFWGGDNLDFYITEAPAPPTEVTFYGYALSFWYMVFAVAPVPILFMVMYLPFLWFLSIFKEVKSTWS